MKDSINDNCLGEILTEAIAREWFDAAAKTAQMQIAVPLSGRGITICAGGAKYIPCVWVAINILRHLGCLLPIELWYLGRREMPERFEAMVTPFNVSCIDAYSVRRQCPSRILNGWELKPYSILHSRFAEVLALDADNVPVLNPAYLFDCPEYLSTGAIFWPDYGRLEASRSIWNLTGVTYRDEPEFETGQIVVDKNRCLAALSLTMLMNEHSDFWYHFIHGDKETFHLAWRKLGQPYAMPSRGIHALPDTMCQHDFAGNRIFQHRNMRKWKLRDNESIYGFEFEQQCFDFLKFLDVELGQLLSLVP